jgi:hypothetical protein
MPSLPASAVAQLRCSSMRCDRRVAQRAQKARASLKTRDELFSEAGRSSQ